MMKQCFILSGSVFLTLTLFSQGKMKSISELLNYNEPAWVLVKGWIDSAKNRVEILPSDTTQSRDILYKTQVTTRSPMGSIVYMTGGLLIDNGWIRILGSGHPKLTRTLPDWNKGKGIREFGEPSPFLIIADDVIGGFFLLNGGAFGSDVGKVYYLSADNLEYEPLDLTYTQFLNFCFNHNLDEFYKGYRWAGWKEEVSKLSGDRVFNFYPPLFTKEGKDFSKNSRTDIPVEEQYNLNLDLRRQLGLGK